MLSDKTYYTLLPKTELHCHFTSTITPALFLTLARKYGFSLPAKAGRDIFDFSSLQEFLAVFRLSHAVLKCAKDFESVAYHGVKHAFETSSLRYREYYINPQYFYPGLRYRQIIEPVISGLRAAEKDFGIGFRLIVAINRQASASAAVDLVREMADNPFTEVAGLGMDDLTPEGDENPLRFIDAYSLARKHGFKTTAHVGETDNSDAGTVRQAIEVLQCDRIDHGYKIMDDASVVSLARDRNMHFTTTPVSTTFCSGWRLDEHHPIAGMIRAGLNISLSTDDAMFFSTTLAREYHEGLPAFGGTRVTARKISLAGIDGAFCDEDLKKQLRTRFLSEFALLDTVHRE